MDLPSDPVLRRHLKPDQTDREDGIDHVFERLVMSIIHRP
jgi:hypothetical protein